VDVGGLEVEEVEEGGVSSSSRGISLKSVQFAPPPFLVWNSSKGRTGTMRPPPVDVMPKRPGEDSPVVTPSAPRNMRREWSSEWAWKQLELLGSPLGYVTSARRNVASAPCVADGAPKLWVHLELQLPLQTLVGGAGNGRLSGLKSALRLELARSLSVASSQVEVWEILDKGGKTTVELVVSEALPSDDLSRVASDLMDQVLLQKHF